MSNLKGVIIDAGHGGSDPGAVASGANEKDLTLAISRVMYDEFKRLGIPVYMTRTSDITLSPSERVKKAKSFLGTDKNIILVSNHINAGGGEGAEVIYALRNNDTLSKDILNELSGSGQIIRKYYQKKSINNPSNDYYFILRDTKNMESVIVEYGFIDNPEDLYRLNNNYKKYAIDVVDAILKYKGIIKNDSYYIVKSGDTLYSIAKKYNTSVDSIMKLNNLSNTKLSIGMKLNIPSNYYIVKKGDTLYSIAKTNNTTVDKIKSINNLKSNIINIGDKIIIPK